MNRRVADVGELFDLLDQIRNSAWISFGYVSSVKVNKSMPTKKIRNPQTNRMNTVNDFSMFSSQGEDEIATIVKVTSYNIQYRNRELVAKQYGNYIDKVNPIRVSYGLNPIAKKEKDYAEKRDFGNGVDVYNGNKEELKGHSYFVQNVHNAHPKSVYYAVNRQGRIIKELSKEQLKPYLEYSNADGVDALKKLGAQDEMVKEFIKKVDDLKFVYRRFIHECILWVAATTKNGDRFTYINNNFNRVVDKISMDPQDFLAIARERYNIGVSDIESMANSNVNENRMRRSVIRLTESDLHRIVNKSNLHNIYLEKMNRNMINEGHLSYDYIDWDSLISDGIRDGKIDPRRKIGNIPFSQILDYAKMCGDIKESEFQVLRKERENIIDAYVGCVKESIGKKRLVRLTESDLHRIVKESVNRIMCEIQGDAMSQDERDFRDSLSKGMFDQSKLIYHGKLANGNTLVSYRGVSFEVTPKGKMKRVQ